MIELENLKEINEYIMEFLQFHSMGDTLKAFEREMKSKQMPRRLRTDKKYEMEEPRLH